MTVAERGVAEGIRDAMHYSKRSQTALCAELQISRTTLHSWMRGETEPPVSKLKELAELCGQDWLSVVEPDRYPMDTQPEPNFKSGRRGAQLAGDDFDFLLQECVGVCGGDGRIRTGE